MKSEHTVLSGVALAASWGSAADAVISPPRFPSFPAAPAATPEAKNPMTPEAKEAFLDSMLEHLNNMDKPPPRDCPGPVYDERCTFCKPIPGRRPIPMPPMKPPPPRSVSE